MKKWRKEKSIAFWLDQGVEEEMPDTLLMTDTCLIALAKEGEALDNEEKMRKFLQPWPSPCRYFDEIFACIYRSSSHSDTIPKKSERKKALKAARASKTAKFMDDKEVFAAARIMALRDQWLLKHNKMTPDLKARLKKAKLAEQKHLAKHDENREKAKK